MVNFKPVKPVKRSVNMAKPAVLWPGFVVILASLLVCCLLVRSLPTAPSRYELVQNPSGPFVVVFFLDTVPPILKTCFYSVWNADSSTNGGNKEWEEEDRALHAFNMQNWRNKDLQAQVALIKPFENVAFLLELNRHVLILGFGSNLGRLNGRRPCGRS